MTGRVRDALAEPPDSVLPSADRRDDSHRLPIRAAAEEAEQESALRAMLVI